MLPGYNTLVSASLLVVILIVMAYNDPCCPQHCPVQTRECCDNRTERLQTAFRPRGALARAIYSKQLMDCHLEHMDHSKVRKNLSIFTI